MSTNPPSAVSSMACTLRRLIAVAALAACLEGCAVVSVAGSAAGASISVAGAVVSTSVTLAGKVAGKAIDLALPDDDTSAQ